MEKSNRIGWVDSAKGILIFLVVLGHCIQNIHLPNIALGHVYILIYYFHMPAFFFISGMLIDFDKVINVKNYLVKKAKRLLIPAYVYMPSVILYKLLGNIELDVTPENIIRTCVLMRGDAHRIFGFFQQCLVHM